MISIKPKVHASGTSSNKRKGSFEVFNKVDLTTATSLEYGWSSGSTLDDVTITGTYNSTKDEWECSTISSYFGVLSVKAWFNCA